MACYFHFLLMKRIFPFFLLIATSFSQTSFGSSKALISNNASIITQAHEYLYTNNLIPIDSDIEIGYVTEDLKNCSKIRFMLVPEKHPSTSLRVRVECMNDQPRSQILKIKIFLKKDYFVTNRAYKRGDTIQASDLTLIHDVLSSPISNLLVDTGDLVDKTVAHELKTGRILRESDFSEAVLVRRNERVKIVHLRNGFLITNFGKSLANGTKNQTIKVQLDNKQFISGKVVELATVEVKK